MTPIRTLLAVGAIALVPAVVAGCGGDDVDPQTVIDETFSNDERVTSGDLSLSIGGSAEGEQGGSLEASLSGPFQTDPDNPTSIPQLDWTGSISGEGAGQTAAFEGGITVTTDNAYLEYGGEAYEVGSQTFKQFKQAAEQAASQQTDAAEGLSFGEAFTDACRQSLEQQGATDTSACEIDFGSWLDDLTSEGTEDIDGTETDHVSGSVNVDAMVGDLVELGTALPEAEGQVPSDEEIEQVTAAVEEASFDLYSGTDDRILRGLDFTISIDPSAIPDAEAAGVESVSADFEMRLSGVNEEQTIEAPANAKPLDELLQQFGVDPSSIGGLGGLGSLGGGSGGAGADTGGGSANSEAYFECIAEAKTEQDFAACESEL